MYTSTYSTNLIGARDTMPDLRTFLSVVDNLNECGIFSQNSLSYSHKVSPTNIITLIIPSPCLSVFDTTQR